jgi:hypothetical protein
VLKIISLAGETEIICPGAFAAFPDPMERLMKSRSFFAMFITAVAWLMSGVLAQAAASSALIALYRISGVTDNGADQSGVATTILCTNWNPVAEAIQITFRSHTGAVLFASPKFPVAARATFTLSTHGTRLFTENFFPTGTINQGSAVVLGTSPQISCSAMIVDAAATAPIGIALHMVRFNAPAGTQE